MLRLDREIYSDNSTIGRLYFKNEFLCWTLENTVRRLKIKHKTAIPTGHYEVIMSYSYKFQERLPLLLDVPYFTGIRIHAGNKPEDTDGCILVGKEAMQDFVTHSKETMRKILLTVIEGALKIGKLYISISGGYDAQQWGQIFSTSIKEDTDDRQIA